MLWGGDALTLFPSSRRVGSDRPRASTCMSFSCGQGVCGGREGSEENTPMRSRYTEGRVIMTRLHCLPLIPSPHCHATIRCPRHVCVGASIPATVDSQSVSTAPRAVCRPPPPPLLNASPKHAPAASPASSPPRSSGSPRWRRPLRWRTAAAHSRGWAAAIGGGGDREEGQERERKRARDRDGAWRVGAWRQNGTPTLSTSRRRTHLAGQRQEVLLVVVERLHSSRRRGWGARRGSLASADLTHVVHVAVSLRRSRAPLTKRHRRGRKRGDKDEHDRLGRQARAQRQRACADGHQNAKFAVCHTLAAGFGE